MTFQLGDNLLEPNCGSMGFKNSPPEFQECVNECTEDIENSFAFFDDVTIASLNEENNLKALRQLFQRFAERGMYLNF